MSEGVKGGEQGVLGNSGALTLCTSSGHVGVCDGCDGDEA